VRVVAGTARGRRLVAPAGTETRPTPDRVREATFNALGSLGAVVDATVLDLFAGSGALGIEALSRGAAHATFVDRSLAAVDAVRANLASCGLDAVATVSRADAERFLAAVPDQAWDLALLDPPHAFDRWSELLEALPADIAVVESDRAIEPPARWRVTREKRYGSTMVTILEQTER
jgi:16S rRNA (guanine966-N2)-methyltransferase